MKIKFALDPYGYEVVLGNIAEEIYNKNESLLNCVFLRDYNSIIRTKN